MDPTTFCNTVAEVLAPRHAAIDSLHEAIELFEANPLWMTDWKPLLVAYHWTDGAARLAESARILAAGQPIGTVRKVNTEHDLTVKRPLRGSGQISVKAMRAEVCEMVDTGRTERVPIVEVPEDVRAAYTRFEDRPIMQRVCPDALLAGAEA